MRLGNLSLAAATVALSASIAAGGCGGSAFTAGSGDASAGGDTGAPKDAAHEGSAADSGQQEASMPGCILPPNGVGGEGAFCDLVAAKNSGCGECEMCHQLDVNDCVTLGDTLSEGFKGALLTCAPRLGCGDLSSLTNNPCVREQLAMLQPTAAQRAVQMAYCSACPLNMAECQSFFAFASDAGTAGFGLWAMVLNESLDQQIASTCSGSTPPHCDALGYGVCGALLFCGKAPHSHCPHGLCMP